MFEMMNFEKLVRELEKYDFKQLHIHHTWKPAHSSFNGVNHFNIQQSMKNHHINTNGWSDIGQHLTLFPDGKWMTGRPFNISPASIKGWNTGALAVEMVGNFDKPGELPYNNLGYDELDGVQKENILKLMNWFGEKYGYDNIKFHRDSPTAGKSCPGTSLNKTVMIQEAQAVNTENKKDPRVDLPLDVHGKEASTKAILYDQTYHVPIRLLEKFGYKVDYKNGKVYVEYKEG